MKTGIISLLAIAVLFTSPVIAGQPTGTIKGKVVNAETKEPLWGVSVVIGGKSGAPTEENGKKGFYQPWKKLFRFSKRAFNSYQRTVPKGDSN